MGLWPNGQLWLALADNLANSGQLVKTDMLLPLRDYHSAPLLFIQVINAKLMSLLALLGAPHLIRCP